jgi:serine protease AprX
MVGAAAAVPHVDLDRFACGRNFTTDTANQWNDQNGHGTHVLGTIAGTGAGNARYRGVAPGVGGSATTQIRLAKIWTSTGGGSQAWMESAIDFMGEASFCGSARPLVVNISGGADGSAQTGTDSTSRKLDDAVWTNRQAYIVCGGNAGPNAQTISSPGVAKNALTVGNVLDNGFQTVGDANNDSSRGPTGDGRMKPNVVGAGTVVTSARAGTTNQYTNLSGCSMATPHVTGIAATLMEHYPDFRNRPDLLRAQLMATSLLHDDTTTPANNSVGGRNDHGLGRVSSYVAHWSHFNANGWNTNWA